MKVASEDPTPRAVNGRSANPCCLQRRLEGDCHREQDVVLVFVDHVGNICLSGFPPMAVAMSALDSWPRSTATTRSSPRCVTQLLEGKCGRCEVQDDVRRIEVARVCGDRVGHGVRSALRVSPAGLRGRAAGIVASRYSAHCRISGTGDLIRR
jgi:hypothetical protein